MSRLTCALAIAGLAGPVAAAAPAQATPLRLSFEAAGSAPAHTSAASSAASPAASPPASSAASAAPPAAPPKGAATSRATPPAAAARTWERGRFVYRAEGKRLTDVLQDFAASQGAPAVVADGVEGVVNANFDARPREFLDGIARAYNLLWYHDGTALYFYPGRAIQSRLFRLKGFRRQQVTNLLRSLELGDKRYPIRYDDGSSTLYVSGPPRHGADQRRAGCAGCRRHRKHRPHSARLRPAVRVCRRSADG
jgi:type III secretion protein C